MTQSRAEPYGSHDVENNILERLPRLRCELLAHYLIDHLATVRSTSQYFGISKSTVHKDITQRLREENPGLYEEVRVILEQNKAQRHLRGGEATRQKYLNFHRKKKQL